MKTKNLFSNKASLNTFLSLIFEELKYMGGNPENKDQIHDQDGEQNQISMFYSLENRFDFFLPSGLANLDKIDMDLDYELLSHGPVAVRSFLELNSPINVDQDKNFIEENSPHTKLLIVALDIDSDVRERIKRDKEGVELFLWDGEVIENLIEKFTITYLKSIPLSKIDGNEYLIHLKDEDFIEYRNLLIKKIQNIVDERQDESIFSLVLGAGVSMSVGAASWTSLLNNLEKVSSNKSKLKLSSPGLISKLGQTDLIKAQLYRETLQDKTSLKYYYQSIYDSLYKNLFQDSSIEGAYKKDTTAYKVAQIVAKYNASKNFRILTYNYDNHIEILVNHISDGNISLQPIYCLDNYLNDKVPIYHVHGYLPYNKDKDMTIENQSYQDSIKLTEDDYNSLYNDAYAWQIGTQLSFFRRNNCIFIGCSLTDPNLRRLLKKAKSEKKKHFAIIDSMSYFIDVCEDEDGKKEKCRINGVEYDAKKIVEYKEQMSFEDRIIATKHFFMMGIDVIWAENHDEIPELIDDIFNLSD